MPRSSVIGWDLGGAHLKAARLDAAGRVARTVQLPCPLWQGIGHLAHALDEAAAELGEAPVHAVTMTGEMVDLFPSREVGVHRLVTAARDRLARPGTELHFFAGKAGFVDGQAAGRGAMALASANWVATGEVVAEHMDAAILVDIGSTTTDLIPVAGGQVRTRCTDDAGRLVAGELVYTGAVRTPVMALAGRVPFGGEWVPLIAEHFATAADVHRLTGQLPEGADQHPSADGGPKTVEASARRLARMTGRDVESAPLAAWRGLAAWIARAQMRRIEDALERLLSREGLPGDAPIIAAGTGRFLLDELAARLGRRRVDFASLLPEGAESGALVTDVAPAVAVAWLAGHSSRYGLSAPRASGEPPRAS